MAESSSARRQLLETAARLFFREGYHAVGVDTIVAASGVSKMTLYRYFPSKEDLIVAYLRDSNAQFWIWFERITADAPDARGKIVAFFCALEKWVTTPTCYGCPFLNVSVDFPDTNHPGHSVAVEHKEAVRRRFRDLAQEAGARDAERLGNHLFLLMDGAFMAARIYGPNNPAAKLAETTRALLDAEIPRKPMPVRAARTPKSRATSK